MTIEAQYQSELQVGEKIKIADIYFTYIGNGIIQGPISVDSARKIRDRVLATEQSINLRG